MMSTAALVALLLSPAPVAAASSRITAGELRQLLDQIVAAGAPGVAARVTDERGVTQAASGVADQETGRSMRPGLHFRVGSVTKSYVATVVLQLVGEGRLSLDDTVERWLPGILPYGDQVTVRQLLNHTGGVPDYVVGPYARLYTDPEAKLHAYSPEELVALVADRPASFPPGTAWAYSNTGYVLAGMIVEAVTGSPLDQEVRRRIVRPLRLRNTVFPVDAPSISRPFMRGYGFPAGQQQGPLLEFTEYNPSMAWAAGAVVSDLGEVQRFFRALLRGRLLPPHLLAEMLTPFPTGGGYGYGLGLVIFDTPTGRMIGHAGAIPGFRNSVMSSEDGRRQIAVMMNAEFASTAVSDAFAQVFTALQARLLGNAAAP
jgi:D-alanyl-D-alanine carboxypeptidase